MYDCGYNFQSMKTKDITLVWLFIFVATVASPVFAGRLNLQKLNERKDFVRQLLQKRDAHVSGECTESTSSSSSAVIEQLGASVTSVSDDPASIDHPQVASDEELIAQINANCAGKPRNGRRGGV
jgi:hypothetical protein